MASKKLPIFEEFCLKVPLYESFNIYVDSYKNISEFEYDDNIRFNCYCIDCGEKSIFAPLISSDPQIVKNREIFLQNLVFQKKTPKNSTFIRSFKCQLDLEHTVLKFIFYIKDKTITKIGQYPSMADLATTEIQQYRKILKDEDFREFSRAVGLVSHGIGIGAFVYLRRIFERLIEESHLIAKQADGWVEDKYNSSKIDQRIKILKDYLPSILVKNRKLHPILSKGIHELSEEECLNAFPAVKGGIELILDEKISKKERDEKEKLISDSITKTHQQIKERNGEEV